MGGRRALVGAIMKSTPLWYHAVPQWYGNCNIVLSVSNYFI